MDNAAILAFAASINYACLYIESSGEHYKFGAPLSEQDAPGMDEQARRHAGWRRSLVQATGEQREALVRRIEQYMARTRREVQR